MSDNSVQQTEGTAETKQVGLKGLLRNRDFRFLWLAQVISDFGDSLTNLALLILINQLTGSAAAIGTMLVVLTIPQIVFGMLSGVYVDRLDRKRLMMASDFLRGLVVLGFVFAGTREMLWLIYVIAFVQASIGTLFHPARSALLPTIVGRDELMAANSISQTSRIIFGLLGTTAAGVLIGVLNAYWLPFTLDALTFFVSFALISRLRVNGKPTAVPQSMGAGPSVIFTQLREGISIMVHSRMLLGTLVAAAVTMLGFGMINVLIIPLIVNDLKLPVTWFGAVEFVQTAGMVLSGALLAVLASRFKPATLVSTCLVAMGIFVAMVSLVSNIWQLAPILFAIGWFLTPMQASFSTIIQSSVSTEMRGRTSAALNTIVSTSSLISMGLAGLLAEMLTVRNVFVLGGSLAVLAGLASALIFRVPASAQTPQAESNGNMALSGPSGS